MSDAGASTLLADAPTQRRRERPFWKEALEPYEQPSVVRTTADVGTSLVPYLLGMVAMYLSLDVSYLLTLALAVPTAGFLLRTYILFHDCTHGSLLPSKRGNRWLGVTMGLFVYSNFASWGHNHAVHHGTAGDLDRRGTGDVETLTVAEYRARSWKGRLGYRLFRNPAVMFILGPIWAMIIQPRRAGKNARPRIKRAVYLTNVALVTMVAAICWLIGWKEYLLIQVPTAMIAGASGVFLFYVQHQFEDVYWEKHDDWSYTDAALQGSSHLKLPQPVRFFTGNIGLHHVHHLSAKIPNYYLQRAHNENEFLHGVPTLTFWSGAKTVRLKLYDEDRGRMVTFSEARLPEGRPAAAASV
jgi:omega-6 fatty acid desaturase (delta-12 desaturase)